MLLFFFIFKYITLQKFLIFPFLFCVFALSRTLPFFSFLSPMCSGFEVRALCPSVFFLFARLGGSLGAFPYLENFVLEGNGLSVALGDLLPLLR